MGAVLQPIGINSGMNKEDLLPMKINDFHKLNHQCENHLRATAHRLGKRLTGTINPRPNCAKAKAMRRMISQETEKITLLSGKRIDIDVTGCKYTSLGGKKYANVKKNYNSGQQGLATIVMSFQYWSM